MSSLDLATEIPRVYIDTSVLGGCFEPEFEVWSNGLMDDFRARRFVPLLSDLLVAELRRAPERVRNLRIELRGLGAELIVTDDEVKQLFTAYQTHAVLGARYQNDMMHIALATVVNADLLVSWNFKHIVRFDKIRLFNAVNLEQGYKPLAIHSPREVTSDGQESNQRG
jgi:predicted nucleic acid-binding protein